MYFFGSISYFIYTNACFRHSYMQTYMYAEKHACSSLVYLCVQSDYHMIALMKKQESSCFLPSRLYEIYLFFTMSYSHVKFIHLEVLGAIDSHSFVFFQNRYMDVSFFNLTVSHFAIIIEVLFIF